MRRLLKQSSLRMGGDRKSGGGTKERAALPPKYDDDDEDDNDDIHSLHHSGSNFRFDANNEGGGNGGGSTPRGATDSASAASHSTSGGTSACDIRDQVNRLAGNDKETQRYIQFWKTLVLLIICLAGAAVSTGIYYYLEWTQQEEIRDSFNLFANAIQDVSLIQYRSLFDAMQGMSNTITTSAMTETNGEDASSSSSTWPFVTLHNYEVFARDARIAGRAELISMSVRVEPQDIQAFGLYAQTHAPQWFNASQQYTEHVVQQQEQQEQGTDTTTPTQKQPLEFLPFVYDTTYDINTGEQSITPTTGAAGTAEVLWQTSPVPNNGFLLLSNLLSLQVPDATTGVNYESPYVTVRTTQEPTMGTASVENGLWVDALFGSEAHLAMHTGDKSRTSDALQPHAIITVPVFDSFDKETRKDVATIIAIMSLDTFLVNSLPEGVNGIYLVIENTCDQQYTYRLDGNKVKYLGQGDLSPKNYDKDLHRELDFDEVYKNLDLQKSTPGACLYSYHLTPSDDFDAVFETNLPLVFALVVAGIFLVMGTTFFVYDAFVRRRNAKVMGAAMRSTAIVTSLFPSTVRERLYNGDGGAGGVDGAAGSSSAKLRRFMDKNGEGGHHVGEEDNEAVVLESKPIADLFPDTTVMFCDIAGFTAWSSVREPSQVFTLLETVYRAFDRMAKQRHVFKVETVGDCYVAVAGCPDPMKNHAVVIARFSLECMHTMDTLTKRLEVTLGPDTGDLNVRIGLHSGPVTAGVLRGERARFQLFGDTMNTAARMESTGERGRIQISEETAELLVQAGKKHWLMQRADTVYAKGKGALKTFWLVDDSHNSDKQSNKEAAANEVDDNKSSLQPMAASANSDMALDSKTERLINWNVDVMWRLLKKVMARRISRGEGNTRVPRYVEDNLENRSGSVLSEVKEIIALPTFDPIAHKNEPDSEAISLDPNIKAELHNYVASIASMYRFNPFHSFEHASHVTMSVVKLLSRIVAPTDEMDNENMASNMHDHTYGITSDPLTQFACVLSALIHDADHPGVPNAQLVKEMNHLAKFYMNQSVAEQNSVDLAWNLLMDENFSNLRGAIYGTEDEMKRFRQLVVNSVMATDIVDKELKSLRNARWEKAFSENASGTAERDTINRKATIVIEHLIQASDVAHTMQHWHIYRKWNERFFFECYKAYQAGRGASNPADNWYKGELGFFDFYIIPLAKKLKECGVFGVSSDEYLNYAQKNRSEWETRGQEIVSAMVEKVAGDSSP